MRSTLRITSNLGDAIGSDQRRNLCRLILGQEGIAFAKAYDDADDAITEKSTAIRLARQTLTAHVNAPEIPQFLGLEADAEIDTKIEQKRREIEGLKQIDSLRSRPGMEAIEMPPATEQSRAHFKSTLETVSRDAEQHVVSTWRLMGCRGTRTGSARGDTSHLSDDCPFCGQSLEGVDLIGSYQAYFTEAYTKFRSELDRYGALPGQFYSEDAVNLLLQKLETNKNAAALWDRYVSFEVPDSSGLAMYSPLSSNLRAR